MSKFILTLPIVVGKKYVRRDGLVVQAKNSFFVDRVRVGHGADVHFKTGRRDDSIIPASFDLVQDYIEPSATKIIQDKRTFVQILKNLFKTS